MLGLQLPSYVALFASGVFGTGAVVPGFTLTRDDDRLAELLLTVGEDRSALRSVTWQFRGVATGATMFARSVGSSVGVAVFGAIANGVVASRLDGATPDLERLPAGVLEPAVHAVFVASAVVAVALLVAGLVMPRRVVEPSSG